MDLLRNAACSRSDNRYGSLPSSGTLPIDGASSPPRMYRSVLLPLPDGPMMATASPRTTANEMSRRILRSPRGVGYDFEREEAINIAPRSVSCHETLLITLR